jgi:hypothetical protein
MLIRRIVLVLGAACLSACDMQLGVDEGFTVISNSQLSEMGCSLPKDMGDMASPGPACAAAKGLSGDVLGDLCLDMDKIDTQGLTKRSFNLTAAATSCAGWEIANNKLLPKTVTTAGMVDCAFALPSIPINGKYSKVILAIMHQVSLPTATQQARIELPQSPAPLPIWMWGNPPAATVDQRTIVELDVSKIPSGPNAQAYFRLVAPSSSTAPTWTITSLAVLGIQ